MLEITASAPSMNQAELTGEVIGLLTAISIVSRRMARNLAMLNRQATPEHGGAPDEHGRADEAANQGYAL